MEYGVYDISILASSLCHSEVFLVSSSSGEGVHDALEWLTSRLKQREGLLASLIDFFNFRESRRTRTISCGSLGVWDPLSMCRYSRLS